MRGLAEKDSIMTLIENIMKSDVGFDQAISDLSKFLIDCKGNLQKIYSLNDSILREFAESFIQESVRQRGAVIILTPGKSGSVTLQSTLLDKGYTDNQVVIRTHYYSDALLLATLINMGVGPQKKVSELKSPLLQVLIGKVAQVLLSKEWQFSKVPVTVLTVLRNDIDVAFASIFQNWQTHFSSVDDINPKAFEKLLKKWYNHENPYLLANWCKTELDPIKQSHKTMPYLFLYSGRYETIFQSEEFILEFLSKAGFRRNRVLSDNIGAKKDYSIQYEKICSLKSVILSRIFLSSPIAI